MLRIQIERLRAWSDSRGHLRSPFEEFSVLSLEARQVLAANPEPDFLLWRFGVVIEASDAPPTDCKPQEAGPPGDSMIVYAVGHSDAPSLHPMLRPHWSRFLHWLRRGNGPDLSLISDELFTADGVGADLSGLVPSTSIGEIKGIQEVGASGRTAVHLSDHQLETLITCWWPSSLGVLAGVQLRGPDKYAMERIARAGEVPFDCIASVFQLYQTTDALDQLGFAVMTSGATWEEISVELSQLGWTDGAPLALPNLTIDRT